MKAANIACLAIIGVFIFQSNPQTIQANPLVKLIGEYLLGKALDYVWDKGTGKPNLTELDRKLKELQDTLARMHPNLAPPIRDLRNSVTPNTSKEDFQRMVQKVDSDLRRLIADLERRVDITDREITDLKKRIAKLEAKVNTDVTGVSTYSPTVPSMPPPQTMTPSLARPESRPTEMGTGRYRDNGDGTIIDTQTNLMWADRDNGSDIDWPSAKRYAANYTAGGYRNWRLPSVSELRDLVDINLSPSDTACKLPNGIHAVRRIPAPLFLSCPFLWSYETRDVLAGRVVMSDGSLNWLHQGNRPLYRVLPVRSRE